MFRIATLATCVLICSFGIRAVADEAQFERVKLRLVEELHEAHNEDSQLLESFITQGVSPEDAERMVGELIAGFADCLLVNLRNTSEPDFSDRLATLEASLERRSFQVVLGQLILSGQDDTEVCALALMQETGVTEAMLPPSSALQGESQ